MEDITEHAIKSIMKVAPVWATSLSGRTKVFTDEQCPTAYVTGGGGRFKIVINPKLAGNQNDMVFILMHEISHIFRRDLMSMQRHPQLAEKINIAADCIINDSLISMGIVKPTIYEGMCWGRKIFKMDCTGKSINELMDTKYDEKEAKGKTSKPGNVTEEGKAIGEEGQTEGGGKNEQSGGVGAGPDPCREAGLGKDPIINEDLKPMAKSIAGYARRMFFEQGFKSKNFGTKNDWRRNRSSFADRSDVIIPRTKFGEYGNERRGPLVCLVLDVSGSMRPQWVATAAEIASEVEKAGLDFDLWLTPLRRKAKNPRKVINILRDQGLGSVYSYLEEMSFDGERHWGGVGNNPRDTRPKGTPTRGKRADFSSGSGADELTALAYFKTEDPVVWIYVGDYKSEMALQMHGDPNFLHVQIRDHHLSSDQRACHELMKQRSLPHWLYKIGRQ